jgi:thiamine biosynthesis lipoprotein
MNAFRFVVAAVVLTVATTSPRAESTLTRFEYSRPYMGTLVRIVLYAPSEPDAVGGVNAAFARVGALDAALSDYHESSELMQVSANAGNGPVRISDDLFRVLNVSQQIARASDGAFDVTCGPLSKLWRQARRQNTLPAAGRIAAARALVGHTNLELDDANRTVRLRQPGMRLDLGGIAKGFAADEALAVLTARGIARALVAAGGDIVAADPPPGAESWRIAIASLDGADRNPSGHLALRNGAVSTSGDTEQFLVVGGTRRSHIFDPRTGQALSRRSSVTVAAPTGTMSDALATAVSVMGPAAGFRLVDATAGASAFVAEDRAGGIKTYASSRWPRVLFEDVAQGFSPASSRPVGRPEGLRYIRAGGQER